MSRFPLCLALLLVGCAVGNHHPKSTESTALRVMSFNIRFGTADDGPNHWDHRRDAVIAVIKAFDPDVLGTQETLATQRNFLLKAVPDFAAVAVGRDDGRDTGEMTATFYRRDRFDLLDSGHFWLSLSPDQPGSKDWDAAITRMATWLKLRDRRQPARLPIVVINTHFDHVGQTARLESARLIRRRAAEMGKGCSVIVMGDFNCGDDDPPHAALVGRQDDGIDLFDTCRAIHPARGPDEATFHAFDTTKTRGARIDWILATPDFRVESAEIDRSLPGGRVPSDHFPVTAVLRR
jgi:endonuclease/exonuclease/phosphatase family metal-dependent hydrolase